MRKKATTSVNFEGTTWSALDWSNDFTVDVESQRPARTMARTPTATASGEKTLLHSLTASFFDQF